MLFHQAAGITLSSACTSPLAHSAPGARLSPDAARLAADGLRLQPGLRVAATREWAGPADKCFRQRCRS